MAITWMLKCDLVIAVYKTHCQNCKTKKQASLLLATNHSAAFISALSSLRNESRSLIGQHSQVF